MLKVHLHFKCDSYEQIDTRDNQNYILEKLTKNPRGNHDTRKYSELFFHLVEYIYRTFGLKSRVSVYALLSECFPIDKLPRKIPSSNNLNNKVCALPTEYKNGVKVTQDHWSSKHDIQVIFLNAKPHIRFVYCSSTHNSINSNGLEYLTRLRTVTLSLERGYYKIKRLQTSERIALAKFYKENVELIKSIRFYAYFRERDITQRLVTRTMSPFWLKASSNTNLEEQSSLINETIASIEPDDFKFIQHKSKKRIPKNDEAKLIEITLNTSSDLSPNKFYAIFLKHSEEGIYISLLDSIKVSNFESDKSVTREMQLNDWVELLYETNVSGDWVLDCKYTYKYDKHRSQYFKQKINIQTKIDRQSEEKSTKTKRIQNELIGKIDTEKDPSTKPVIEERYTLNQDIIIPRDYGYSAKNVDSRGVARSEKQKKADNLDYINAVEFTVDHKKPLKLNLSHLPVNTKDELVSLLNDWSSLLDTFNDKDLHRLFCPKPKKPLISAGGIIKS